MNKKRPLKIKMILLTVMLISLSGCTEYDDSFYEVSVPTGDLREIKPLKLTESKQEPVTGTDTTMPVPEKLELSLEQARALTLENNLDIKAQLISPAIAEAQLSAEEAKFEAVFSSNIYYTKTDRPVESDLSISGSQSDYSNVDLGIELPLQTGGTINFDMADSRTKSNFASATFNPSYGSSTSLSISQPLLKNAGQRTNTHSIRLYRYEKQIIDARTKLEVISVIASADRVYWRLYAAREELKVRKQQYELAQAQLEKAKRFVDAGQMPQVEIIRAQAGAASQLAAIITAENQVRDRQRELKRILNKSNAGIQTPTVLITKTRPDPVRYDLDNDRLVEQAIQNRMELLELELQIAADVSNIDYLRNQALPYVNIDYTYNINGLGPTRSDSYDLLGDKTFEDHRIGLNIVVPLGNEEAKNNLRKAFYQRTQRLATRRGKEQLIQTEVLNAIDQLETNWQQILASRQSAILDGRLYEAEVRQFELGLRTSTDVLQAQTQFADSQTSEIRALAEYQIAVVYLAYATGTLLGAAKIQWDPIFPDTNQTP